ncbi:hypothetical protein P43SY_005623 [Pythium insidiosum]|uniref:Uncharacterized protein n=1 Tax=Pythium insidiosum TaxID=114742 RepID=A0AAD5Q260_PYTIN|nr:hypothetical protein P43SY_005623 [Pythium insidiosum]
MLTAQAHAQPSTSAPPCSAKVDALKEGAALARHEVERIKENHRELVQKLEAGDLSAEEIEGQMAFIPELPQGVRRQA